MKSLAIKLALAKAIIESNEPGGDRLVDYLPLQKLPVDHLDHADVFAYTGLPGHRYQRGLVTASQNIANMEAPGPKSRQVRRAEARAMAKGRAGA